MRSIVPAEAFRVWERGGEKGGERGERRAIRFEVTIDTRPRIRDECNARLRRAI